MAWQLSKDSQNTSQKGTHMDNPIVDRIFSDAGSVQSQLHEVCCQDTVNQGSHHTGGFRQAPRFDAGLLAPLAAIEVDHVTVGQDAMCRWTRGAILGETLVRSCLE